MKIVIEILIFLSVISGGPYNAAAVEAKPADGSLHDSWVRYYPYAPEKNEYQAEVGGMWEKTNLYWLGITYGHHVGRCLWAETQSCQQYFDVTGGFGNADQVTHSAILGGLRWQFVSFPKPFSPLLRVFAGVDNVRDETRGRTVGAYGAGIGFAATVHPRLDVKWELRAGQADLFWAATMITFSMRIGGVVDYFTDKIISVGASTVEATGSILHSTVTAPKTFIDWFNKSSDESNVNPAK